MGLPYEETCNGYEKHWQILHLGPHALFIALLPALLAAVRESGSLSRVRVVNVSSDAAFSWAPKGGIYFDDVNLKSLTGELAPW